MKKRTLTAGAVIVAAASITLSACSGAASQNAGTSTNPVTLNLWEGFAGSETAALKAGIAKYWAPTHPYIKVNVSGSKTSQAMLTAMSGGNGPDVVMSGDSESPGLWFHDGAIMDLSSLAASMKNQLDTQFVPAALEWSHTGAKWYALPFENYDWGIFYNKKMFAQASLDPNKPPTTITELEADAKKLTKVDGSGNITQLGWMPVHDQWSAMALGMAFGAKFVNGKGAPTLDTPAMNSALTWDLNLAESFGLKKVENFISGFTQGSNPFALGKVAIYIDGMWQSTMLQPSGISFGVGAVPAANPAYANSTDLGTNPIVVPVATKYPEQAKEFAKFMATNEPLSSTFAGTISNLPQLKSSLATFTNDPNTKFFATLSSSSNSRAWAPEPYAEEYSLDLNTAVGNIYNGGASVSSELQQAQATVLQAAKSDG